MMYRHRTSRLDVHAWLLYNLFMEFQYSVGDNTKHPTMGVLVEDDETTSLPHGLKVREGVNIVVSNTNALWAGEHPAHPRPGVTT